MCLPREARLGLDQPLLTILEGVENDATNPHHGRRARARRCQQRKRKRKRPRKQARPFHRRNSKARRWHNQATGHHPTPTIAKSKRKVDEPSQQKRPRLAPSSRAARTKNKPKALRDFTKQIVVYSQNAQGLQGNELSGDFRGSLKI